MSNDPAEDSAQMMGNDPTEDSAQMMSNDPTDPRSEWEPLGWELEGPSGRPGHSPEPLAAEVVAWVPPDDPPHWSRGPSVAMVVASVLLAVLGLVGIGIGIASVFFDQSTPPAPTEVLVVPGPQVVSASSDQPSLVGAPVPVTPPEVAAGSDQSEVLFEPVVRVAQVVRPSVVLIVSITSEQDRAAPPTFPWNPRNNPETPDQQPRITGQGSGIIYDASGLILTNAHVVGESESVRVQFADGTWAEGTVEGTAPAIDVALVRVDTDKVLTPAVFADRSTVEVGQLAVAVGSPFGLQQSVTAGVVSAVGRAIREGSQDRAFVEMIQTDASINLGNSGGALANRHGQVIGMTTLIHTAGRGQGNIGLGFAIPSDIVLNIAQRILAGESTELGYLGVMGTNPELGRPGALVLEVLPDTPAEQAGMMDEDLIVLFDGEVVTSFTELAAKVQFRVPGTEVKMQVLRDEVRVTLTVVIGSLPTEEPSNEPDDG
ncbi:S1C family serine protease [Candidatus Poriferisocius sp.]|uniref:S1C family serine protease n=1 Tax=Candidatus Poriferisocius sp. TaxID=3101276 RepID=UPI003B011E83